MARIKHPRFQPGRTRGLAGIEFIDGYAEVDLTGNDILAQALAQHGYTVEEAATLYHGGLGEPIIDLTKLTVRELRELAKIDNVEYPAKATKAQLVDLISRLPAEPIEGFAVVELPDGTVVGDGTSLVTLHEDGTATVED